MRVLVAGDFCPAYRVPAMLATNDYSFLEAVRSYTASSDVSIVNFECTIVPNEENPIKKIGPNLSTQSQAIEALKWAGFNVFTLANNHILDYARNGLEGVLNTAGANDMHCVGAGLSKSELSKILYVRHNNSILAVINCCEHEFSVNTLEEYGANELNPVKQYSAIREARQKADYVMVIIHGGPEHYNLPIPRMQDTYRFFIDVGADVVINHHQHCYSGYEEYKGKWIFYGLGNFCFDRKNAPQTWKEGMMVQLIFKKNKIEFQLIPYLQANEDNPAICIYNARQKEIFNENIKNINAIILDGEKLEESYMHFLQRYERLYQSYIEPYFSRVGRWLYRHHVLPSIMHSKYRLIGNVVRCESHRDRLMYALLKYFEK